MEKLFIVTALGERMFATEEAKDKYLNALRQIGRNPKLIWIKTCIKDGDEYFAADQKTLDEIDRN